MQFVSLSHQDFPNDVLGQTKFRTIPANDAIIFRFTSPEQYYYIKDFVKNNKTIQEAIKPNDTFIPTDDANLNVLPDDSGSYNYFLATVIFRYLKNCLFKKVTPNTKDFTSYIEQIDTEVFQDEGHNSKKSIEYYKKTLLGKLYGEDDIKMIEESLSIGSGRKLKPDTE